MRTVAFTLVLTLAATEAWAIARVSATSRSCAQLQALLKQDGAALLQWPSADGQVTIYNRYVGTPSACTQDQKIASATVPSKDVRSCRVSRCAGKLRSR